MHAYNTLPQIFCITRYMAEEDVTTPITSTLPTRLTRLVVIYNLRNM